MNTDLHSTSFKGPFWDILGGHFGTQFCYAHRDSKDQQIQVFGCLMRLSSFRYYMQMLAIFKTDTEQNQSGLYVMTTVCIHMLKQVDV